MAKENRKKMLRIHKHKRPSVAHLVSHPGGNRNEFKFLSLVFYSWPTMSGKRTEVKVSGTRDVRSSSKRTGDDHSTRMEKAVTCKKMATCVFSAGLATKSIAKPMNSVD